MGRRIGELRAREIGKLPAFRRPAIAMFPAQAAVVYQGLTVGGLTPTEYATLHALAANPGAILSRTDLLGALTVPGAEVIELRSIDTHIHAVRRKLAERTPWATGPGPILSLYGKGWMWHEAPGAVPTPVEAAPAVEQADGGGDAPIELIPGLQAWETLAVHAARQGQREMEIARDLGRPIPAVRAALIKARALGVRTAP